MRQIALCAWGLKKNSEQVLTQAPLLRPISRIVPCRNGGLKRKKERTKKRFETCRRIVRTLEIAEIPLQRLRFLDLTLW